MFYYIESLVFNLISQVGTIKMKKINDALSDGFINGLFTYKHASENKRIII